MAGYKALIFTQDGVSRCQAPDFIDLGHLNLGAIDLVTINNGTINLTKTYTGASPGTIPPTNQIHTINGGVEGTILVLRCWPTTITISDTGNLRLSGNFKINNTDDTLVLLKTAQGTWLELSRSNNG